MLYDTSDTQLEAAARSLLSEGIYDFVAGGAGEERTLRTNIEAFSRYRLVRHVLRGAGSVETATRGFSQVLSAPIIVAPMGSHALVHKDGELATVSGAGTVGLGFVSSTASTSGLELEAAASSGEKWFQLYIYKDRGITRDLVERARDYGYSALCVTADAPVLGRRLRDSRNLFRPAVRWANLERYAASELPDVRNGGAISSYFAAQLDASVTWGDIEWLVADSGLPVLVKGVCSGDDAELAVQSGASGVYVSNHGGRQLDGERASLDAVSEVAEAVDGRARIVVDGGVRSGRDVAVCLSAGADLVGIGRPVLWALACGGADGVSEYLSAVVVDLQRTLTLLGAHSIADLDRTRITRSG